MGEPEPRTIVSGLVKFVPIEKMQVGLCISSGSDKELPWMHRTWLSSSQNVELLISGPYGCCHLQLKG